MPEAQARPRPRNQATNRRFSIARLNNRLSKVFSGVFPFANLEFIEERPKRHALYVAEMMDEDNFAWGPSPTREQKRHSFFF